MSTAQALPILMYHHVSPQPGLVTVSPENFRDQMHWLAHHGWHTVGTAELEAFLAGAPLPARSVMLTFDDGYLDNFIHAYPVLREYGHRAVIFAITGSIGDGPVRKEAPCPDHKTCKRLIAEGQADTVMLRWSEIEAMEASGHVEIHSHTHSHRRWDLEYRDPAERLSALAQDLAQSRAVLEARLGRVVRHLCWPWGLHPDGYDRIAEEQGLNFRYLTVRGVVTRRSPRDGLARIAVKDQGGRWLEQRLAVYRRPWLAYLYLHLRGKQGR
ncbi:polysaccharide deacetylase family protein [Thiobacter aerophilum]|uniref:Polysaccharide deacetylase family protein n=1 Tax=Thiobacter aerophilum TaxID=3121275 RepID=A0ABV0ECL3_9BURK